MRTKVSTVNASQGPDGEASQQERSGSRTKVLSLRGFLLDMGFLAAALSFRLPIFSATVVNKTS